MEELVKSALKAREKAYAPYSNFKVGAAVLGASGRIYSGCNIENAAYGLANCAERTAVFKAISEGETEIVAIAVAADTPEPVSPCGACRQVMAEFNIEKIILVNLRGRQRTHTLAELLPFSFNKSDIEKRR
ncbi:cytidine deaminase [Sporomusa termitida]|uniref:Cytidine deaminase n=1 Tax=Sporomusa termitida TaxID=2377 RepID=A0A517DU96_9FIRM|nr:cytidine deaminase [Sporomusa termitida]QDR80932.1 Cytidine deaminase [Sporomusa termitida]